MEFALDQNRPSKERGAGPAPRKPGGKADKPDWAEGLRQLYDSVVEEPIPDSFADLIKKLDD